MTDEPTYGPEAIAILRGMKPPPKRSSAEIGGIDWSQCDDAERIPGKLSGAWCVKGHRVRCEDITGQFEAGCSAEEIAGPDIYSDIPLAVVRRILRFAYRAELHAIQQAARKWPNLPDPYQRRADVLTRKLAELDRALRPRPTRKPVP